MLYSAASSVPSLLVAEVALAVVLIILALSGPHSPRLALAGLTVSLLLVTEGCDGACPNQHKNCGGSRAARSELERPKYDCCKAIGGDRGSTSVCSASRHQQNTRQSNAAVCVRARASTRLSSTNPLAMAAPPFAYGYDDPTLESHTKSEYKWVPPQPRTGTPPASALIKFPSRGICSDPSSWRPCHECPFFQFHYIYWLPRAA